MTGSRIANRYARAFLDFLGAPDVVRATVNELRCFHAAIESHPELNQALTTPLFSAEERVAIVKDVGARLGIQEKTQRLLLLLADAKRLDVIGAIAERLNHLVLFAGNVVPMGVVSADELSGEDRKKLETKFSQVLGKKVEATYEQDSNVIGGVKVTAGGRTFDGSLSGWLTSIEEQLLGGNL